LLGKCVSTGVEGLDELIEGGFQRGSLILLAGNPGTGKTTFGAQFVCKGANELDEVGVYVSFAENRETFVQNMLRHLGRDCEKCLKKEKCRFLDLVTVGEKGVSAILELILAEVERSKAKRLVIDSFSAMVQAFEKPIDARIVLHTILGKVARQAECTTLLLCEVPVGKEQIGLGIEEFVADGVILLRSGELDGRLFRDMEIKKLRGIPAMERTVTFTLSGGFKVSPPFKFKPVEKPGRFKPTPDQPGKFSTGSPDLDRLLDGGYPKGATVLIEVDKHVTTHQYHLITTPIYWNFIVKGRAVIIIPSTGIDHNIVKMRAKEGGITEDEMSLVRIFTFEFLRPPEEPYIAKVKGENIKEDMLKLFKIKDEIREKTGQPILSIVGVDMPLSYYGENATLKAINTGIAWCRENESLDILLLKPGYPKMAEILGATADIHLKITREHGTLILYGVKPRTGLHMVEMDTSKGYRLPKLTPIT
jgi:circadian clock protein KaiC